MSETVESLLVSLGADDSDLRSAFADAEKTIKEFGDGLKDVGESMSTTLSLPLSAFGGLAGKVANDFDSSQGRIQAQLGLTASEAEELGSIAEAVWKENFGENVREAGDAVANVKQNLKDLKGNELKEATENAFILRDAFEFEVNESTRAAKALMDNFGVSGTKAFDYITIGAQKGGDYSGELLDTISEYSTYFSSAGISVDGMFNILVQGAQNGAWNLDKVGDAVKEFGIRAVEQSKTTAEGFSIIGLNADEMNMKIANGGEEGQKAFMATVSALAAMEDPIKRNQAGVDLFGTQWEDLKGKVITSLDPTKDMLGEVEGATQKAGDALYDNFGARAASTWRETQDAMKPIGDILLDFADDVLPKVSSAIENVSKWFTDLSPSIQNIMVIFGMIVAAIGPFLMILGSIASGVSVVVGWFAPLVAAIAEAGGLMAWLGPIFTAITGPIGITIAAIAGLIGIFVALYKNNEDFRNKVQEIWTSIQSAFQTALSFIMGIVSQVMSAVTSFFGDQLEKIRKFWDENGAQILHAVQNIWSFISGYLSVAMQQIIGIFQICWPILQGIVQIAWGMIKNVISSGIDIILGIIKFFSSVFTGDWRGAFDAALGIAKDIWHGITGIFRGIDLIQIGKDILDGLIKGFDSMVGTVEKKVKSLAKLIPDGLKDFLGIHSPSRLLRDEVGKWIPAGLAEGISANLGVVTTSVDSLAMAAIPSIGAGSMKPAADQISHQMAQKSTSSMPTINVYPKEASLDEEGLHRVWQRQVILHG